MKRTGSTILPAVLIIGAALLLQTRAVSAEIKFGILPRVSAAEERAMFGPLVDYLSKETGEKVSLVVPKSFEAFKDAAKAGQMDVGFSNPLVYIQIKENVNVEPLALSSEVKSGTRMRGIIIARKDSGITKVQDLKGKKLAFMAKSSAGGYIFQMLLLSKAGLDVKNDFSMLPFAKKHVNVARAVLDKSADGGAIREDELEKIKDKVDISQFRIVGYTDYFPNWPFFATGNLNPEIKAKIRSALLKLKPNDPQNKPVLSRARLTGFIAVSDSEYDELRKAARIAGAL